MCCWFRDRMVNWLSEIARAVYGKKVHLSLQSLQDVKETKAMGVDGLLIALSCTPLVASMTWLCQAGLLIKEFLFCVKMSLCLCLLNRIKIALFQFPPSLYIQHV